MQKKPHPTSWQGVAPWYNKLVGSEGHYYHEHVVLPGLLKQLNLNSKSKLLDLGCGQGILAKRAPIIARYLGIDAAPALIEAAKKTNNKTNYSFEVKDATRPFSLPETFTHAAIVLALQNMKQPEIAIENVAKHLEKNGKLVIVLNHPCFRIPRQSGWGVDEKTKQQYRWINRYATPLEVPITMNPGRGATSTTWSFHHSLSDYSKILTKSGFVISSLEEWNSDKESVGKAAKMENRARSEFPLFLSITALKVS